jgi:hypothetical protein
MLEDDDDRSLALAYCAGTGTGRGGLGGEGNLHDDESVGNASENLPSLEDRKFGGGEQLSKLQLQLYSRCLDDSTYVSGG